MTDLETAARAALEIMKGIRDDDTAIAVETGQRYFGKYARAVRPHIAALEAALAAPGLDPTAIRRAALEEAAQEAGALDPEKPTNYLHRREDIPAAIRALADREPTDGK